MFDSQLRVFHAVARLGSFSAAAQHLNLTQPAISEHVRKIEQAHGIRLFTRSRQGAALTETGKSLYALTERLTEASAEAHALLARTKKLEEGSLAIGADSVRHAAHIINAFRARHPAITLRLVAGNSDELVSRLRNFEIDVAVVANNPQTPDIVARRLRSDRMVLVTPARYTLKPQMSTPLSGDTLLVREEGSATRRMTDALLTRAVVKPKAVLETASREAMLECIAAGLGVGIVSGAEVPPDRRLAMHKVSWLKETMHEWVLHLASRDDLGLLRSFGAVVRELAGKPLLD